MPSGGGTTQSGRRAAAVARAPLAVTRAVRSAAALGDAPVDPDLDVVAAVEELAEPPVQPLSQRAGDEQHVVLQFPGFPCHTCTVPIVRRVHSGA